MLINLTTDNEYLKKISLKKLRKIIKDYKYYNGTIKNEHPFIIELKTRQGRLR